MSSDTSSEGTQLSLTAFAPSDTWELIAEGVRGEELWLCPDCCEPLIHGWWPSGSLDVDAIPGAACPDCRLIMTSKPRWAYDAETATLRSGEEAEIRVHRDLPDYIDAPSYESRADWERENA